MKDLNRICIALICMLFSVSLTAQEDRIDTKIDNWRYWKERAEMGLIPFNPDDPADPATYVGDQNRMMDGPDVVLISGGTTTQSENSVFVDPNNNQTALVSNNSTLGSSVQGTNALFSFDGGATWTGGTGGAGGNNSGDPAAAISLGGTSYIGHIAPGFKQGVSISNDNGVTWSVSSVSAAAGFLDKNHLWVDNSGASSFQGNVYSAWTNFGGANNNQIEISRSTNNGTTWSAPLNISGAVTAGSHNQGVNIQTGPNGEVYAVWAIYDSWPSRENAIGFSVSTDGGVTYSPATRIFNNIQGVRWQPGFPIANPHGKNMRSNSFPGMAVDISGGPNNGTIYVTWANVGVPGVNTGSDVSIYVMSSTDSGATWSTPLKVNTDPSGNIQYFPWITCDPVNGNLSIIFYDDRNVGATEVEAWVADSTDGGLTWSDFRVSDVSFTPAPIPGLAGGYMGDYLGISANGGNVYPVWTDNRSGTVLTYTSPYTLAGCVNNLVITTDVLSGSTDNQEALNTITASNTVNSGATAVYHAGDEVLLVDDFDALNGSVFRAYIEACTGVFTPLTDGDITRASKPRLNEHYEEDPKAMGLSIYPNPTHGVFNVGLDNAKLNAFEIEIYSISRGLLYSNAFQQDGVDTFQIDISNFPDGVYVVKLITSDTQQIYTGKIIKDR
ncbi:T9SS type A sorting domain-containing protein [Aureisphaera galaxeae]|uniref:T9SS type A sorting domain-containing protein n=1 Tax=Aureisphaera galaxeae TaxID=1538023 RepID=UPI0023501687|nr:3-coathanger stack domain-containing protein [Aureisphaera galaxeae]MDC8002562.1 T9SS type A sorting domain-containing protein [Aureisphaera galaxeae]